MAATKIYKLNRVDSRVGGDLANFLRLTTYLPDLEPVTYISSLAVETTQLDYDTGFILRQGGNPKLMPQISRFWFNLVVLLIRKRYFG